MDLHLSPVPHVQHVPLLDHTCLDLREIVPLVESEMMRMVSPRCMRFCRWAIQDLERRLHVVGVGPSYDD
jgi:hypothetical protein